MPKRFLSFLLSIFLILPLFAAIWSFVILPSSSFAKADEARKQALALALSQNYSTSDSGEDILVGEKYIVKFKNSVSLSHLEELLKECKHSLLAESESRLFAVVPESKDFFKKHSDIIEYYEADLVRSVTSVNDPLQVTDFDSLGIYDAWETAIPDSSIVVAVLDTGVFREHEDLKNAKILSGYDAVAKNAYVGSDSAGHGTGVIGIIAATANNELGIAGVASGVTILPIKVSVSGTTIYSSDLIRGIRFAADSGAKIINMSVAGYSYSVAEQDAINYAAEKGCIIVAAAGNGGNRGYSDKKSYPASYENVISVASCDENGNRSNFSQYNDMVDVAVIGENITMPSISSANSYITDSGTSFSCAIVSGIAALAAASAGKVRFENAEFMALIIDSLNNQRSDELGHGIINAFDISQLAEYPIVTGVTNGSIYSNSVKVFFNRGTARLDGEIISDGEAVFDNGTHRLTVSDNEKTINLVFRLNYDPLDYEFREFPSYCYFKFSRGTALLDGFPYKSEEKITKSGNHTFIITDGDERLTKEFVLEYALPKVYGIENGKKYSTPVEISVVGKGSATLNDENVQGNFVVYKSGKYTLTVKSGNDSLSKKYSFEIDYPDGTFYDIDYENGISAVDEENGYICLYGESLVGVRIYDISSPEKYLHFLPVGKVYSHAFNDESLLLFGESGITVINRDLALEGEGSIIKTVSPEGISLFTYGEGKIFGFGNGGIYTLDLQTEEATLLYQSEITAETMLFANKKILFASPSESNIINIFDTESQTIQNININKSLKGLKLYFSESYFAAGNIVYDLEGNKILEFQGFWVNEIIDGKIFTDNHIIDIITGKVTGSLPFYVSDIEFTENKVYLIGADANLGIITCNGSENSDYGAANPTDKILGFYETVNDFRTDCLYASQGSIIASAAQGENIYLIFSESNCLYSFNAETLDEKSPIPFKFLPAKIFASEDYIAITFKRTNHIYVAPADTPEKGKYLLPSEKCNGFVSMNGSLYVVLNNNLAIFDYTNETFTKTSILADYIASDGTHLFISDFSGLYKYNSELSLVAKSNSIKGDMLIGNGIAVDNVVYNLETLKSSFRVSSAPMAFRGSVLITADGIYSLSQKSLIGTHNTSNPNSAVITEANRIAVFENGVVTITSCQHEDEITASTEITGIEEGGIYTDHAKIEFTHGIGYLDGVPFESGSTATGTGKHTLTVTLPFGNSVSVSFTIAAQLDGIKFLDGDKTMSVGEKLTLGIQYLPEGAGSIPVTFSCNSNGLKISEHGEVTASATGTYTVTAKAVTDHGTFTTSCAITVRSDIIAFTSDSGFTIDRDKGLILGVPVGTTAKELFEKLASGKSSKLYTSYGKENEGYVGTGNRLILKNSNGEITDELIFAVVGDTDGDGFISAYDLYIMEEVLKTESHSPEISVAADVNFDSQITNSDFRTLRSMVLGVTNTNMGDNLNNPFGSVSIQTISQIQEGDIIEAVLCISGCKYAKGLYGKLNFGEGLEFIECESSDWDIDFYEYSDSISFYGYDGMGRICGNPFKALIIFRFRVTAKAGESIKITSNGLKATFADGCKTVAFENYSSDVSSPNTGDFEITFKNAVSFTFNPEIYDYSIVIPFNSAVADIGIICGEGETYTVSSRFIPNSGTKTVTVGITYQSGNTEYYNIEVKRDATPNIDSNCKLMILEIEGFKLSPSFVPEFLEYDISVPFGTESINVYCVAENKTAAINISDTAIPPEGGEVIITVSAPDGESLIYRINVNVLPEEKTESSQGQSSNVQSSIPDEQNKGGMDAGDIIALIILLGAIVFCVITYIRNNKTEPSSPTRPDAVEEALKEQE